MTPVRVLQINAGSENFGGVSAIILNIYKNIDRTKVQFDFLTPNKTTYALHRTEIESMGGRIFEFGINSSTLAGKMKLIARLKRFLQKESYDVIHINSGVLLFNCVVAYACHKFCDVRIFLHSHNNGGRKLWKEKLSLPLKKCLERWADVMLACSDSAAAYMYTAKSAKKTIIVKNGIDAAKFSFNVAVRNMAREELNISDSYVIGNVGRFMPQKNHVFMIDVFQEVLKKEPRAVLMLIGQGELLADIKERIHEQNLDGKVLFLGEQKDVSRLYQAMDVFFLPSIFEGFGIVNIEAQSSGLLCVASDQVPREADVTNSMIRLPLNVPLKEWSDSIMSGENVIRRNLSKDVISAGYDIKTTSSLLEKLYCKKAENKLRDKIIIE